MKRTAPVKRGERLLSTLPFTIITLRRNVHTLSLPVDLEMTSSQASDLRAFLAYHSHLPVPPDVLPPDTGGPAR